MSGARPLALVAALVSLGCQIRSQTFVKPGDDAGGPLQRRDGGLLPDARDAEIALDGADDDGRGPTGDAPDGCTPRPEICNGVDDDCDGVADDGFELSTDPENCGRCGNVCRFENAQPRCSLGRCLLDVCQAGFVDLDRLPATGCECALTNEGKEICDGKDNDCNGLVDEGFDLESDVQHCGACGHACAFDHAAARCERGMCQMAACEPGWVDLDKNPRSGCEYECTPSAGGVEICDTQDNDCDGEIDESDPRAGSPCFPEGMTGCDPATGQCQGDCALGTWACRPGGLVCTNPVLPRIETCDAEDNDCDGQVDEGFDLQTDPGSCGACGRVCMLPNAINGCAAGACTIKSCRAGWVDLDRLAENGCEYACTADGPETCDGKDNDCDGQLDVDDPDLLYPATNFCSQVGECGKGPGGSPRFMEATFPVCTTSAGAMKPDWICNYPATVQLFAPNQVLGQESWCDGLDNDCDGMTDEHPNPPLGAACTDNGMGQCRKAGVLRCQADKTQPPGCDVTGAPVYTPTHETCNGKDDDCDGHVDESFDTPSGSGYPACGGASCQGVRDEVVHVTAAGSDYYIYRHEASRVDAAETEAGEAEARSCSRAGVLPWTVVSFEQAKAACEGAGMRLCKVTRATPCSSGVVLEDEWGLACHGGLTCGVLWRSYPYGCDHEAQTCNGIDAGRGTAAASPSNVACVGPDLDAAAAGVQAAYDLSGNVAEWTDDCRGTLADGSGRRAYTLRGGGFGHIARALRCDFTSLVVAETFTFNDTGFRCCSSCPPGQADCGGACVNLGTDANNCGRCGVTCGAGRACVNGRCD